MDKRTLIAVVISVVLIGVSTYLNMVTFAPKKSAQVAQTVTQSQPSSPVQGQESPVSATPALVPANGTPIQSTSPVSVTPSAADATGLTDETHVLQTSLVRVVFTDRGAAVQSFELLKHLDHGQPLEMINSGTTGDTAFNLSFGDASAPETDALFHFTQVDPDTFQFSRDFVAPVQPGSAPVPFTLVKTYLFRPDSYMLELKIQVKNSINQLPNLQSGGFAYTLQFGPQIGPTFQQLGGNRGEYRNYYYYVDGKRKTFSVPSKSTKTIEQQFSWAAIVGKYFTAISIPDATAYALTYSSKPIQGLIATSEMLFSRPPITSSNSTDLFQFYLGPKDPNVLAKFDDPTRNAFGTSSLNLQSVVDTSTPGLGWLVAILNVALQFFYGLIPNWGVAIIVLTVVIKVLLFPFTRRSFESTAKMAALSPKLKVIQDKHKNNPQKLNQEMAALYKREGVSPLGGCLPLLLQMPFFFALYGLLNTEFQLRGAVFIPGWITDLSAPESVLHFSNFVVPFVGWTDLRLLPIIYVGSQLLSAVFMQTATSGANNNMKAMTYLLPIVFFFVLYNAPSGLLVYWTVTNVLTVAQQQFMNATRRRKQQSLAPRKA